MGNPLKYLLFVVVGTGASVGCAPKVPLQPTAAAPVQVAPKPQATRRDVDVKDESTVTQRAGQAHRIKLPDTAATVFSRLVTPKATYLLLKASHKEKLEPSQLESVADASGRALVAAVSGAGANMQSLSAPDYELILRIPGPASSVNLGTLKWTARRLSSPKNLAGGYEQVLTLNSLANAPIEPDLEARFGEAMATWFERHGNDDPFMTFAGARLIRQLTKHVSEQTPLGGWRLHAHRTDLVELMDFYTGRSTVRNSLQMERGLQLPRKASPLTIDPSSIRIRAAQNVDYAQLVAKDSALGAPIVSQLASVVPADALVIEFASLKDVVQLPRLLDQKLGQVLRVAEASGGPNHLIERYRNQLAIELDGFAETVGQFAVKSVSVVFSDPYLREGTDLTLVFRAENQGLLEGVLANHLARAKLRHPDLATSQEKIAGETVAVHSTPDGSVRRYEYAYGDYRILTNSKRAVEHIIQVKQGKLPKLSEDKGYVGARALAPFDAEKERAFIFFGDAFVANVVGPRSKILEARRMRAQSELEAVDHGALLFGWLEGRPPTTLTELLNSGWVNKADLVHSDGSKINWSPAAGAHSRWGTAKALTPLADLPYDKVGKDEVTAYESFRSQYDRDVSGMLDPTSLRVERTPDAQELHTILRVFPIMPSGRFGSDFREITHIVGEGRVEPGGITRGLGVTLGVGKGSPLRNLSDETIHDFLGGKDISISFVGDWVRAGLDEGSVIWDLAAESEMISGIAADEPNERYRIKFDELLPKLPAWVAVNIKSRLLLTAALTALRDKLQEKSEGLVKWHKDDAYREIPITRVSAKDRDEPSGLQINVYYGIAKDVFLVSLRRKILEARIDDVLEGRTPKGAQLPLSPTQLAMDVAPVSGGWLRRAAQASLDTTAYDAHERACLGFEILSRAAGAGPTDPVARRDWALRLLGYEPESPQAGALNWHGGLCEHPVFGNSIEPRAPDASDPKIPLHEALSGLGSVRFALGLIPRGNAFELWARFQLNNESTPTTKFPAERNSR
jgi:hypothetical protein